MPVSGLQRIMLLFCTSRYRYQVTGTKPDWTSDSDDMREAIAAVIVIIWRRRQLAWGVRPQGKTLPHDDAALVITLFP